jgi:metallo-beta-lactamase family protein
VAGEATGSYHLITVGKHRVLLDCGMVQGGLTDQARNAKPFSFDPPSIDAVVLSHAHIDHSGRIPFLDKSGFKGLINAQKASGNRDKVGLFYSYH